MHETDTGDDTLNIRNLVYICPVDHQGNSVFVKGWVIPENNRNLPIILIHDIGESVSSFTKVAQALNEKGFNTYSFDMRGHGLSKKKLEQIISLDQLAADLLQVVAWVKHKENGQKPILVSQGIGSLVVLSFAKLYSKFCQSIVLVSPFLSMATSPNSYKRLFIRWFSEFLPRVNIPKFLCPEFTNKKVLDRRNVKISYFFTNQLLMAVSQSHKLIHRLSLPTLIICPIKNPIAKYEHLKRLVSKSLNPSSFHLKNLESEGHLLLSEEFSDEAMIEILSWIEEMSVKNVSSTPLVQEFSYEG